MNPSKNFPSEASTEGKQARLRPPRQEQARQAWF
jgi:hypothetical protein